MSASNILAVLSLKGGVAKTTSAINIAASLAEAGKKTLLVDLDPHTGASLHLGYDPSEFDITIADVLLEKEIKINDAITSSYKENLFLIPSNKRLTTVEKGLEADMERENLLSENLKDQTNFFDYIIMDSPPIQSFLLFSVLKAARFVVVPFRTNHMSFVATKELVSLIGKVQQRINPPIEILGYFGTMFDNRTKESRNSLEEMQKKYQEKVFNTTIPSSTILAQAARGGVSVIDYDRNSKAAQAYQNLTNEILARLNYRLNAPP